MSHGHNLPDVTFTERGTPDSVVFTERSAAATKSLEPLRARKNSDDWWLFNSGLAAGDIFAKNTDGWQLLNGTAAFGAAQRMGQEETGDFVLVIEDNS